MIHLVSNNLVVPQEQDISMMSVMESLLLIQTWPVVQFDTETTGLDAHIAKLKSMQFGYYDFKTGEHDEIVVDCDSVDPKEYKDIIERSYIIGHNLKFDLQFLYNYGIVPLNIYDTMVCEQLLYLGYRPGQVAMNLRDVLYRYTGIEIDKSFQKEIAHKGLTIEGIRYAAGDVVYLQEIRKGQIQTAESRKCLNAFTVENRFVPAIAYLEWCGIRLDEGKWREKMQNDKARYETALSVLNDYVRDSTKLNDKFVSKATQLEMFTDYDTTEIKPECTVDWASPQQVIPVFKTLGFNTTTIDKRTKKERDSVEKNVISVQKGIDDEFVKIYYDYKEAEKKVSTYGQNFLNVINPNTGRIHTNFEQFGTVTGRMCSGSGDEGSDSKGKINRELAALKMLPASQVRLVNLQNLPARGEEGVVTRACFVSSPDNVFISCDFSAEESRVQADVWQEEKLLNAFRHGIDTHNLYAKLCFPEELKEVDVKDVKAKRSDLRQLAKSA